MTNNDKRLLELLERWQSGDFSRADERELWALADSDDFRREAVEGIFSLPELDHAKHLDSLREHLRKRIGGSRRVSLNQIFAAAAAIALLVSAAIWLIPTRESSPPMAQKQQQGSTENQPIASNLPEEKNDGKGSPPQPEPSPSGPSDASGQRAQSFPASPVATSPADIVPDLASEERMEQPNLDKAAEAKPTLNENEYAAVKNEQDDLDLSPGNAAKPAAPKKDASGFKKKKAAEPTMSRDTQKQKIPASANESQPVGGWSEFQDYLRRNARLPEAARQKNVSGSVRLRFRLDDRNQPVDFNTIHSLGYGCDEEAISLVKAFSWVRGHDPELTVDVPFIR